MKLTSCSCAARAAQRHTQIQHTHARGDASGALRSVDRGGGTAAMRESPTEFQRSRCCCYIDASYVCYLCYSCYGPPLRGALALSAERGAALLWVTSPLSQWPYAGVAQLPAGRQTTPCMGQGLHTHRDSSMPIRTCIVFLDRVQNLHIHAVRARSL